MLIMQIVSGHVILLKSVNSLFHYLFKMFLSFTACRSQGRLLVQQDPLLHIEVIQEWWSSSGSCCSFGCGLGWWYCWCSIGTGIISKICHFSSVLQMWCWWFVGSVSFSSTWDWTDVTNLIMHSWLVEGSIGYSFWEVILKFVRKFWHMMWAISDTIGRILIQ